MKTSLLSFLISLMFIALFSCYYEPEGQYYKDIDPPTSEGLNVNLNASNDTVYLFTKTTFGYHADIGNRKLRYISGYLNQSQLFYSFSLENAFTLDPKDFEAGTYTIQIKVEASSGTGSLADLAEEEKVFKTIEWILIVDKSPPAKVELKNIYPESGTLWVEWERYPNKNFQAYLIKKYCYNPNYGFSECGNYTVTTQDQTRTYDSAFLEGLVKFELRVKASDQISDVSGKEYIYDFDSDFNWRLEGEKTAALSWKRNPFYKNFKTAEVSVGLSQRLFSSSNIVDTTYSVTPLYFNFSTSISFQLTIASKGKDTRTNFTKRIIFHNGETFFPFSAVEYNAATNRYYVSYGRYHNNHSYSMDSLIQVNGTTNKVENRRALKHYYTVSENGNIIYIAENYKIHRIDPNTFNILQSYDLKDLINDDSETIFSRRKMPLLVSNNNILVIPTYYKNYVVDMNTATILLKTSYPLSTIVEGINCISHNAELFYLKGTIYTRDGQEYKQGLEYLNPTSLQKIHYINADSAVAIYTSQAKVFNPTNGTIINTIPFSIKAEVFNYDPISKKIMAYRYSSDVAADVFIYDLKGNSESIIKVNDTSSNLYCLLNSKLICSSGYIQDFH